MMLIAGVRRFAQLLAWGACVLALAAPAAAGPVQTLRFTHLTQQQGLNDGTVMAIHQDRQGLIWIGTANGLARYDGRRMVRWQPDPGNPKSLSSTLVSALLEDEHQRLWLGTSAGLDRLDLRTERITHEALPESIVPQHRRIWALAPNGPERLWVATQKALLLLDPRAPPAGRFTSVPLSGDVGAVIRAMVADGQGGAWVAYGSRVFHVSADGQAEQRFDAASAEPDQPRVQFAVRTMALAPGGALWLGTDVGLQLWHVDQPVPAYEAINARLGLPRGRIFAILFDEERTAWVGYGDDEGLVRIGTKGEVTRFRHHPSLPSSLANDSIATLFQDRSGALWVGMWDLGISLTDLRERRFTNILGLLDDPATLSANIVMAIAPEGEGRAWVGTYGGGLNDLDLATGMARHFTREETGMHMIKAMLREGPERFWLGGDQGLTVFNPRTRRASTVTLAQDTPGARSVSAIVRDANGMVWAASAAGLYRIGPDLAVQTFKAAPGVPGALRHDWIDSLLVDRDGNVWVGSKVGLQIWRAGGSEFSDPIAAATPAAAVSVYALHQDARGRLWAGTSAGLYQLVPDGARWRMQSWREVDGMPPGWIVALQEDAGGDLWMAGERGLVRLNVDARRARLYQGANGAPNVSFNIGAAARTAQGQMLFGGYGVVAFLPEQLRDNLTPVQLVLSDILESNQSLREGGDQVAERGPAEAGAPGTSTLADIGVTGLIRNASAIALTPRQAMISFEFAALRFTDQPHIRMAWKLDGFDADWIYGKDGAALATYTNLDPGTYVLRVKVAAGAGPWNESALTLPVQVSPPFWRSWWFRLLLLATTLVLLLVAHRMRVAFLERSRRRLEREVAVRTRQVQVQKDQLKVEKEFAETQREAAERARRDILLLSEIGQEIGASLDVEAITEVFCTHVAKLMDAEVYGIGLVDWRARSVVFGHVMEHGVRSRRQVHPLDGPPQALTRCVLRAEELSVANDGAQAADAVALPASMQSALLMPLLVKEQVIGLIMVGSSQARAYDQIHLDMLRTLGAYAAVALDKAAAYADLKLAQARLVEQEKLGALGSLVAGVAHELNTPIGNGILAASSLQERSDALAGQVREGSLRRSDIDRYCAATAEAAAIIVRNLGMAARLVARFKEIAADQASSQRRRFELASLCEALAQTFATPLREGGHCLLLEVAPDIWLDSYPGPLEQVLASLIGNAIDHGLEGRSGGRIVLTASLAAPGLLQIACRDDGRGMADKIIGHIFEPFFTTRLGQGSNGLGLHVSYNIVHSILCGTISVESVEGEGSCFTVELPLVAPHG